MSRCRIGSEEGLQNLPWVDALSSGGLHEAGKDAVGFQSAIRSGSEAYLAEDHQVSERLFRMIVGGWYAVGNRDVGSNATLNAGDKDRGGGGEVMGG